MKIEIEMSDLDFTIFGTVAADPVDWIRNAANERVRREKESLLDNEIRYRRDNRLPLDLSLEQFVQSALERRGLEGVPAPEPVNSGRIGGELTVVDGEVSGFETSSGLGFAMALDTGVYWIFFTTPQTDTSYIPFVQSTGFNVDVTDRQTDYFEVTVYDRSTNEPAEPATLSISVQRI